jgi:hypothetical protein
MNAGGTIQLFRNVTTEGGLIGCVYAALSFVWTVIPVVAWDSMAVDAAAPSFNILLKFDGFRTNAR